VSKYQHNNLLGRPSVLSVLVILVHQADLADLRAQDLNGTYRQLISHIILSHAVPIRNYFSTCTNNISKPNHTVQLHSSSWYSPLYLILVKTLICLLNRNYEITQAPRCM